MSRCAKIKFFRKTKMKVLKEDNKSCFTKKGHRVCTYREKLEKHHKIILMLSIHVILFIVWLLHVVYVALNVVFYNVTADIFIRMSTMKPE